MGTTTKQKQKSNYHDDQARLAATSRLQHYCTDLRFSSFSGFSGTLLARQWNEQRSSERNDQLILATLATRVSATSIFLIFERKKKRTPSERERARDAKKLHAKKTAPRSRFSLFLLFSFPFIFIFLFL